MNRLARIGVAAILLAPVGCAHDDAWTVGRMLGWEEVKTPKAPDLPPATLQAAERVDTLGRKIIAQNTFTGIEPLFHTVGVQESVLFHIGPERLVISEGLVNKCKSETELAAVLCSELGQMIAEKKGVRSVGRDYDQIPGVALVGGTTTGTSGGTPDDPGRQAELAFQQKQRSRSPVRSETDDAVKTARDLLRGAGYDPTEYDRAEPLLKQSERGAALRKQMSGSAPAPKWDK